MALWKDTSMLFSASGSQEDSQPFQSRHRGVTQEAYVHEYA